MNVREATRIAMALNMALDKPQLLPYLRKKIKDDFRANLDKISNEEIDLFLKEQAIAQSERPA